MHRRPTTLLRRTLSACAALAALLGVGAAAQTEPPRILLFSKTAGFYHSALFTAVPNVQAAAEAAGMAVDATTDAGAFTDANLAQYDAVVFLLTSGDVLDDAQQAAFERFIQNGNGYAGIHSASDTEYSWPWYGDLVGAYFDSHPPVQEATLHVETTNHASTEGLPATWVRTDEWYNFDANPRANVTVLMTVDETTYTGGTMGADHPIAWYHEFDGGRAWYTGGGHRGAAYSEPDFMAHVIGGIEYAAGLTAPPDSDGDGIADDADNCLQAANADQRDTDSDGYGNVCDADLNGDCRINATDLGLLRSAFFGPGPHADFDGDGVVNAVDLGVLRAQFFGAPGPAAAGACAAP